MELQIDWQRLVESGQTCPRCMQTGDQVRQAARTLDAALSPVGIRVRLTESAIALARFQLAPLESNRILLNDRTLEQWLGGQTGHSQCCDVCGPNDCRTVSVDGESYESIPAELIVRAGVLAAAEQLGSADNGGTCCAPAGDAESAVIPVRAADGRCCG